MIPAAFDYERATSIDDALARLQRAGGGAKLIAGGHSLVPLMKLRLSEHPHLIDIARIPELAGIRERDGDIEIGAATVHHDIATSALIRDRCPMLAEAASEIGDPQVRHRGTLGGSLAHADPAADYPAVVLALDANINLRGPKGARAVPARDFFLGLCTVDLAAAEIIVSVGFKPVRSAGYSKLHQRASHFAIVGVAAALTVADATIKAARIGLTGAGSHAVRLAKAEAALTGRALSDETIRAASQVAGSELATVNADLHAGEGYRRAMIPVFTRRALEKARSRAESR
jgi:carbon-monoxide dehydrogenase medium subunit